MKANRIHPNISVETAWDDLRPGDKIASHSNMRLADIRDNGDGRMAMILHDGPGFTVVLRHKSNYPEVLKPNPDYRA